MPLLLNATHYHLYTNVLQADEHILLPANVYALDAMRTP